MAVVHLHKKAFLLGTVLFTTAILVIFQTNIQQYNHIGTTRNLLKVEGYTEDEIQQWWAMRIDMKSQLSELGKILFLDEKPPDSDIGDKKFRILVWKYGSLIENRHMKQFSNQMVNPFEQCSVKNCDITYKDEDIKTADIVIFHLHRFKGVKDLPSVPRNPKQIWAFLTDESPYHTFLEGKNQLKNFNGIFNWSMTYRMDSDIPVPYGRTVLKNKTEENKEVQISKRRDVLVAIMGSNCGSQNHRWEYVKELQKHIKVDVYGKCGTLQTCPGHFKQDCTDIDHYLFYLAFENSNCDEYLTEKLWWNAFEKNSIPIVMGSDQSTYKKLLPIDSYLNVDDFASPRDLAEYIKVLNQTEEYVRFYQWKKNFDVLNEHGYFQSKSFHYCRVCEALNYNKREKKVYDKLEDFWSAKKNCHASWDAF